MTENIQKPLAVSVIGERLKAIPDWRQEVNGIRRTYLFKDFIESIAFVNCVATLAEKSSHHPDILVQYNHVTLTLSTHSAGGLTDMDFALAEKIDRLVKGQTVEG